MKRDKDFITSFITLLLWFEKTGNLLIHLRNFWVCSIS